MQGRKERDIQGKEEGRNLSATARRASDTFQFGSRKGEGVEPTKEPGPRNTRTRTRAITA